MDQKQDSSFSRHFTVETLAEGVFAAVHQEGGCAFCNTGIIDLGNRTLVFDTGLTPRAGRDLRRAAEALTGRPVSDAINSHYHNDHIWGNQAFSPETDIIATPRTRQLIASQGKETFEAARRESAQRLKTLEKQDQSGTDGGGEAIHAMWLAYYQGIVDALPELEVRLPNLTFSDPIVFHGTQRTAELIPFPGGHSESDCILYLPEDGIVFTGDLLCVGSHPYLADGDPAEVIHALGEIRELGAEAFVPGHGPVGTAEDLDRMEAYIADLERLATQAVETGEAEDRAAGRRIPPAYAEWALGAFFEPNLRFIHRWLSRG